MLKFSLGSMHNNIETFIKFEALDISSGMIKISELIKCDDIKLDVNGLLWYNSRCVGSVSVFHEDGRLLI